MSKEIAYVICVTEDMTHTSGSVQRTCSKCGCTVWCTKHNEHLVPICMNCTKKLDSKTFHAKRKDLMNAYKVINPDMSFEEFAKLAFRYAKEEMEK